MACPANNSYDVCGLPYPASVRALTPQQPAHSAYPWLGRPVPEVGICVLCAGSAAAHRDTTSFGCYVLPTTSCDQTCVCHSPGSGLLLKCHPHACGPVSCATSTRLTEVAIACAAGHCSSVETPTNAPSIGPPPVSECWPHHSPSPSG